MYCCLSAGGATEEIIAEDYDDRSQQPHETEVAALPAQVPPLAEEVIPPYMVSPALNPSIRLQCTYLIIFNINIQYTLKIMASPVHLVW